MKTKINHAERAHSKFSASGSERWLNCAGSVALEEQAPPSVDSVWSVEGTVAHEVLEKILLGEKVDIKKPVTKEMLSNCLMSANKVRVIAKLDKIIVEKRIYNNEIHPEMFGTCDVIIPAYKKTLHIIDFKYGQGHVVSPEKNTQLIQYALAVAESYDWDEKLFPKISMHILQPRATSNWHKTWTITMKELKEVWLPLWHKGVKRVESGKGTLFEGAWCHWCRAKNFNCSKKQDKKDDKVSNMFANNPFKGVEDEKESSEEIRTKENKSFKSKSNPFEENSKPAKARKENRLSAKEESFEDYEDAPDCIRYC